jgi:predicted amidophosphoribosyltransferase
MAKDHHRSDALAVLSRRLAYAVAAVAEDNHCRGLGTLVPVPSMPQVVRSRGLDFTSAVTRRCSTLLGRVGITTEVVRPFRYLRSIKDQSGLTSGARESNVTTSLSLKNTTMPGWIIVVDDVVTTGATLREVCRAMRAGARSPDGLAVIADTSLRQDIAR